STTSRFLFPSTRFFISFLFFFFFSSRRRHTRSLRDWSSDVCSSDLGSHCGRRACRGQVPRHARLPQCDPRAPPPHAAGNGHAAAANGGHRARQPVQPRAADLDAPVPAAAGPAVPAGALMATGARAAGTPAPGVVAGPHDLPVFVLTGPTGAGKTDWALGLAESAPVEIVSVDSALVYRGLDIGTAKPARELRERVPHHLIDICEPTETYSAGRFVADPLGSIRDIHARGRVPLLVGGTMLYLRSLLHGLAALPQADPLLRSQLNARAARHGWPA